MPDKTIFRDVTLQFTIELIFRLYYYQHKKMKVALIAYDLKAVKPDDNANAKAALLSYTNTYTHIKGFNLLSPFLERVVLKMPDTTIAAEVDPAFVSPKSIADEVITVIKSIGAIPDKVYVAFIDSEYLWNSEK